jgi:RNA-binding protein 39
VRLQRERERELAELERATRTVFAFNINIKADERDIFGFFSKAGQVHRGSASREGGGPNL